MKSLTFKTAFNTVAILNPGMGAPCFVENQSLMSENDMMAYVVRLLGSTFTDVESLTVTRVRVPCDNTPPAVGLDRY